MVKFIEYITIHRRDAGNGGVRVTLFLCVLVRVLVNANLHFFSWRKSKKFLSVFLRVDNI